MKNTVFKNLRAQIFLLLLLFSAASPAAIVMSETDEQPVRLLDQLEMLEAAEDGWLLQDVIDKQAQFFPVEQTRFPLYLAVQPRAVWLKFTVENPNPRPFQIYIEAAAPELDSYEVYGQRDGVWESFSAGDMRGRDKEQLQVAGFTSLWPLVAGENAFYIRIRSKGLVRVPLTLYNEKVYVEAQFSEVSQLNIFRGIGIGLLLFHLLLYIQTKDATYLAFVGMVASVTCFYMFYQGGAQAYLPLPNDWHDRAPFFFSNLYMASALWFHTSYLKLKQVSPRQHTLTVVWSISYCACALLWSLGIYGVSYYVFSFVVVAPYVLFSAMVFAFRGHRAAIIYLAATMAPLVLIFYGFLGNMDLIEAEYDLVIIERITGSVSLLLFSIGLAERINMLHDEKTRAQLDTEAKSAFLAKMSHEIRTPMNGVLGMSKLLSLSGLNEEQRKYNDIIQSSGSSLLQLINDLLDFSKIEAGKLDLEHIPFSIADMTRDIAGLFQVIAEEKGINVIVSISKEVPDYLVGDPTRIRQIVINLINNALKFTREGQVEVSVLMVSNNRFRFSVRDTGIGISEADIGKLFKAFSQASTSTNRQFGGTGLGLAICKDLVDLMAGEIGVVSGPGKGSEFWFELPLEVCHDPAAIANLANVSSGDNVELEPLKYSAAGSPSLSVLVAEDNAVNQTVIRGMLKKLGHQMTIKEDGKSTLDEYVSNHGDYDVILMDCEMPGMDGFEASRSIRDYESKSRQVRKPIIALTAHAVLELQEKCLNAGMDDHLAKPVNIDRLKAMLDAVGPPNQA